MSALPLGRYRELLDQLLHLNEQTAALRKELGAWMDTGGSPERSTIPQPTNTNGSTESEVIDHSFDMESSNSSSLNRNLPMEQSAGSSLSNENSNSLTPTSSKTNIVCKKPQQHVETVDAASKVCTSNVPHSLKSKSSPSNMSKKSGYVNGNDLDLKHTEMIDSESDHCNLPRKPHFLDDDYHLKSNDVCRIPKPHFLDHSPSPDDEKIFAVDDAHLLNDDLSDSESWNKSQSKSHGETKFSNVKHHNKTRNYKEIVDNANLIDKSNLKTNSIHCGDMHSVQSSSSSSRYYGPANDMCFTEKDSWHNQDSCSVKSFSSAGSGNAPHLGNLTQSQLGPKVDCVYSLLSLLSISSNNNADMSDYLFKMSQTIDSCIAMRQSGCIPLLVQLIHSKHSYTSREKAAQALHNLIHAQPDDKAGRREVRVLRLLEQVREYCHLLDDVIVKKDQNMSFEDNTEKHPTQSVAALMKLSFDEEHRHVMCQLGGLQALAALVTIDQKAHGSLTEEVQCVTMRKYSGMALTNLTFGDGNNKALLCSFKDFMIALVDQLQSPSDDMRQVTAAVLRNLSWRADSASKQILREVGAVKGLTVAAMTGHKEATLKSVLSALWNLTAHCSLNKVEICSVEGALAFLVDMLSFDAPSKTLAIIENAGGILRNVSSHIAVREEYRQTLREHNCLKVLLQQLKSPSLTIVSNSCGTLWNLSARCQQDQQYLWDHGAIPMLRSLIHSKHKMISMGSSAALKNLLNSKPGKSHITSLDSTARDLNLPLLPTLGARKQKALEHEIDQNLAETCENIEPATSPSTSNREEKLLLSAAERHLAMNMEKRRMTSSSPLIGHLPSQISLNQSAHFANYFSCGSSLLQTGLQKCHTSKLSKYGNVNRSDSKDSVTSTHSDSVYERVSRNNTIPSSAINENGQTVDKTSGSCNSVHTLTSRTDSNFIKRYSRNEALGKYDHIHNVANRSNDISRNNYSESGYDIEQDCCDQPIDYSQKYSETKSSRDTICENIEGNFPSSNSFQNLKSKDKSINSLLMNMELNIHNDKLPPKVNPGVSFGDYQETDLDQPTDYSLRYAEDQSDVGSNISETQVPSVHEDTIKHFCTEGTPYETPINFSTATSMSDLRAINSIPPLFEKPLDKSKMDVEVVNLIPKESSEMSHSDEKDVCSLEDPTKHDNDKVLISSNSKTQPINESNILKYDSKFSSGITSPDKPVNYCEEGTPGYFSRVSSLSSLEEIDGAAVLNADNKWESEENTTDGHFTPPDITKIALVDSEKQKDCKTTPLENNSVINYSEETPLMFSRCSSLGSLSECSVPDQPDDMGSVVSEFSRMTSGCISPSELPDSPTQSPLPRLETSNIATVFNKSVKHLKLATQPINRLHSVFEDEVSTFKFEHTPIEFSTGTSLSSLTIDDEPTGKISLHILMNSEKRSEGVGCSNPIEIPLSQSVAGLSINSGNSLTENVDQSCKSNGNSEQECDDILAACIDAGVQSRIKTRNQASSLTNIKNIPKKSVSIIQNNSNNEQDSEKILLACIDAGVQSRIKTRNLIESTPFNADELEEPLNLQESSLQADTFHTYCTEDTPLLSKIGSQSDLSSLSINEPEHALDCFPIVSNLSDKDILADEKNISDDSSNIICEDEDLLAECINSGIPKSTLPSYLIPQDEIENYAVEGSPFQCSLYSSLSDLTIDSEHSNAKARLFKSDDKKMCNKLKAHNNKLLSVDQYKLPISQHSPNSSLSSVSFGSDDGHILDMAIKAGVPRGRDEKLKEFNKKDQKKSLDSLSHCTLEDKSEEHVTVLTRNDSLSSLSVDSLGSNEGEQAILEQCIKSGMPKARPVQQWDEANSKMMIGCNRSSNNIKKHHIASISSAKPFGNISNNEFDRLVPNTECNNSPKTNAEIDDNALLEEVINRGIPKRKNKIDKDKKDSKGVICNNQQTSTNSDCVDSSSTTFDDAHKNGNSSCSKNVQATSAVDNGPNAIHQGVNAARSTSDVKLTTRPTGGSADTESILSPSPPSSTTPESSPKGRAGSDRLGAELSSNGTALESLLSDLTIRNGFENIDTTSSNSNEVILNFVNASETTNFGGNRRIAKVEDMQKNLFSSIEASTLCQSLKYDFTMVDSITTDTCHSPEKTDKHNTDTWNENTCPNDVSFSTVSGSIPLISSFKSDIVDEGVGVTALPDLLEESVILTDSANKSDLTNKLGMQSPENKVLPEISDSVHLASDKDNITNEVGNVENVGKQELGLDSLNDDANSKFISMTNSAIIESEATRLAIMMKKKIDIPHCLIESGNSLYSLDLDQIKPPSQMGSLISLTQSVSGNWDDCCSDNVDRDKYNLMKRSIQNSQRKKSIPHGIIRKAFNNSIVNPGSLEHLDNNSLSNLDNIKPPSEMDDVLDMENSMISVASIVSEVAEVGNVCNSEMVFDLKQSVNTFGILNNVYSSINIENINPPSLFDEMTESAIIIDNLNTLNDSCITYTSCNSNQDIKLQSDSQKSSMDSSGAKDSFLNKKYLTPKQKRQLTKDRYKTYTIGPDINTEQESSLTKFSELNATIETSDASDVNLNSETFTKEKKSRLNPKQRRQEDRARYQTQTVCASSFCLPEENLLEAIQKQTKDTVKSEVKKTVKQKRIENSERYRTRTLDGNCSSSDVVSDNPEEALHNALSERKPWFSPNHSSNMFDYNHSQLVQDTTKALEYLQKQTVDDTTNDIDCETMSLVSEDETELNSLRLQTFSAGFRNYLPVIESPSAADICIEKNLKNLSISQTALDERNSANVEQCNDIINDLNSLECDQNSGTESADQNVYSDSDGEDQAKNKPKIIKPEEIETRIVTGSNGSLNSDENAPKGIRGRRKTPYISPYRRNDSTSRKSPAKTVLNAKTKMTLNSVSKGSNSHAAKNSLTVKKFSNPVSKTVNIAYVKNSDKTNFKSCPPTKKKPLQNSEETQQPEPKPLLVRQGTFTKEESTVLFLTKVNAKKETFNSKLIKPANVVKNFTNTSPSKLPLPPTKSTLYKPSSAKKENSEPLINKNTPGKSTPKTSQNMKNSASNQSLQSDDSVKTVTLASKTNILPKYSSNSSINSATSSKTSVKDVSSKVANLWKKVEQQRKVNVKPDVRVWVTNNSKESQDSGGVKSNPHKTKLTRSSTFEGSSKAASSIPVPPKQKSSIAIRVSQSPVHKSSQVSKVPVVKLTAKNTTTSRGAK